MDESGSEDSSGLLIDEIGQYLAENQGVVSGDNVSTTRPPDPCCQDVEDDEFFGLGLAQFYSHLVTQPESLQCG